MQPTIDECRGTYREVGIRSTRRAIERVMGRSRAGNDAFFGPLSPDPFDYGLPVTPREPPGLDAVAIWQFKDMAAVADRNRAWLVGVTARDAATKRGIATGNALDAVKRAYPDARCGIENRDTGWPEFPYCEVRVARQRYVYFGEDPIRSISLSRAPMANTR